MTLLPTKEFHFKLNDSKDETLDRLKRRTEHSESLSSNFTEKSFRGIIKGDEFKVISSEIGIGALWVINGKIENQTGYIKLEINKVFKIFLIAFLLLPILGLIVQLINNPKDFLIIILVSFMQLVMIRFFFIGFFTNKVSKHSINKIRDVLDVDFI